MREAETTEKAISVALPESDASDFTEATIGEAAADPPPVPDAPEDWEGEDDPEAAKRRYLLWRFWHSASAFWSRGGDRLAWPLSAAVLAVILLNLGFQYGINVWNRVIFDALEKRDSATVFFLSAIFLPLAAASICCGVGNVYGRMTSQRRWRAWLTQRIIERWLRNGRYFQLNLVSGDHDNPEYRIAQDLRIATDAPIDFAVGVVSAALSAATFITVLWTIGGSLSLDVGGATITISGFLVIAAVIYAALASGLMLLIGRRFVTVSEAVNQTEADYRYVLTRVRENGESIALLGGEEEERAGLDRALGDVLREWRALLGQHMRTTLVSQGSSVIAPVVPIILSAPKFLDGSSSTLAMGTGARPNECPPHRPTALTIEELAREVGLSRSALADRFMHFVGQPPMHYLGQWRMQVASGLLSSGGTSIAAVASDVGYGSEAAFSRAFKKLVGTPPAVWRRRQGTNV
jgi:vitamin B12/bleomycin/antimicrobial peptide transport system ATP-binding/permease protein